MRILAFVAAAAATILCPAQVQYFELSNGAHHEGRIAGPKGASRLDTAVGSLPLPEDLRVRRCDPFDTYDLVTIAGAGLHPDHVAGQVSVAALAARHGAWHAAREHLNRALAADPDCPSALALAGQWAAKFQLSPYEAGPKPNERKALEDWIKDAAVRDWVGAAMVETKLRAVDQTILLRPTLKMLKSEKSWARWCAARALTRLRSSPDRIKPLYRRGILDPSPTVRTECVRALKATEDPVFCRLFARSLESRNQAVRMAAARALSELGMIEGADFLVRMVSGEPPVAPRSNIVVTTQVAYVKDYDVEVAQNAVIADPVIDVAQDGMALDVAVVSVTMERRVYFAALRRITRQDFGTDPAAWRRHLAARAKSAE